MQGLVGPGEGLGFIPKNNGQLLKNLSSPACFLIWGGSSVLCASPGPFSLMAEKSLLCG